MANVKTTAVVIAAISVFGLAGCTHGTATSKAPVRPEGSPIAQSSGLSATTPPSAGNAITVNPTPGSAQGNDQYAGMSSSDWNSVDQGLSQVDSALNQSDMDAAHTEQGDATP